MFSVLLQAVCLMTEGKCFAPFDSVWTVESGVSVFKWVCIYAGRIFTDGRGMSVVGYAFVSDCVE